MIQSVELDLLFYFCLSSILFQNCEIIFTHDPCISAQTFASYFLFVVQFSRTECSRFARERSVVFRDSFDIIPPTFPFVNTFFEFFWKNFRFPVLNNRNKIWYLLLCNLNNRLKIGCTPYIIYKGRNPPKEVRRCFTWSTADIFSRSIYQY